MREMKNSGIEWIGEIPVEWNIIKCKYVASLYTGNSIKDENKSLYEDFINAIPYISTKDIDVVFNTIDYENGLYIKDNDYSFVRANKNDILMCIEGGSAGRKKARLDKTVCFVNKLCCFHATKINSLFLYYLLNSPHYEEEFKFNISGLIGGVSKNKLENFIFPYPMFEEQQKISTYLDDKCTKINRIIERQQKIIDKLKEYKQSIITEAVTKGLNPDVKMKNSGIEWIGEIPEHWNVGKIGYFTIKIGSGKTPKGGAEVYSQEGILFLRSQNIYDDGLKIEKATYITEKIDEKMFNTRVYKNDVLLNITGGSIGRSCIYSLDNHANVNQHVCIIRTIKTIIIPQFMHYFWISDLGHTSIKIYQTGANREGMNFEQISKTLIPITSLEEQNDICNYLDQKCSAIDSIIKKEQTLIEKLKAYKKSLIYEVVTGKKEV